jgi:ubiquitin C-terminal hydrolase
VEVLDPTFLTRIPYFQGLFKSTVTCPECNKVSVTFDPFAWVSLPLVQEAERVIEITIVRYRDTKTPVKYAVRVCASFEIRFFLIIKLLRTTFG